MYGETKKMCWFGNIALTLDSYFPSSLIIDDINDGLAAITFLCSFYIFPSLFPTQVFAILDNVILIKKLSQK